MRAVKSIILAAGAFKASLPYEKESFLIYRAISDCNLPKFTSKDGKNSIKSNETNEIKL
jgi:dynein heavy chain, axonemal